jgi:multidrug efflux pump subunit AcrB
VTFLTRLSLRNRLLVGLLAAVIAVFGVISANSLNQELTPSISTPGAAVSVNVQGASPESLETQVTEPLETALKAVPDLDSVVTTTSSGSVIAQVTWPFGTDGDGQVSKIETAVDRVESSFPDNAVVNVASIDFDAFPVVQYAFTTTGDRDDLIDKLELTLVPELQSLDGVQDAELAGQDEQRVGITLRPDDVEAKDIDTTTLSQILQANGVIVPAGTSDTGSLSLPIEVGSTLDSVDEIAAIAIPTVDGPVLLSEIADVALEPVPETSVARVNGMSSLTLGVTKTSDANLVTVARAVNSAVAAASLGSGVEKVTVFDQAPYIEQSIEDLLTEGGLGLIFAVLVILLFLWAIRPTIIAAISIPMSLLITLTGLWVGGFTLNIFTLGALTIAIGRVVDDSIVVIENIKRRQGGGELTPGLIVESVKQVAGPVTASTITTVAVFLPIAFVSGIAGELFRPFAVTVTIALLSSLLVALTIVPTLAYWFLRRAPKPTDPDKLERREAAQAAWEDRQHRTALRRHESAVAKVERANAKREKAGRDPLPMPAFVEGPRQGTADPVDDEASSPYDRLQRRFVAVLGAALRHRGRTIAIALVVLLGTGVLAGGLKVDFLSQSGQGILSVSQEMPLGSSLETTDAAAQKLEAVLEKTPGVESYVTTIGSAGAAAFGGSSSTGTADISVTLDEGVDEQQMQSELDEAFSALTDVGDVTVGAIAGTGLGGDIELVLTGDDLDAMGAVADDLQQQIAALGTVSAASSNLTADQPVLSIDVDHVKAAEYGYTPASVGQAVADAIQGQQIGTVTLEGVERDIVITPEFPDADPEKVKTIELPVTQLQNGIAQQNAADDYADEQEKKADEQAADAEAEINDGIAELRDAKKDAEKAAKKLQRQIAAVQAAMPDPADFACSDVTADCTSAAYVQAYSAWQAQLAGLQSALAQAQSGPDSIDDQIESLEDQLDSMAEQRDDAEEAADRQEEIADTEADPITVADVATVSQTTTPATITREDGDRQVTVSATPKNEQLAAATAEIQAILAQTDLPAGIAVEFGGVNEQQTESFTQLGLAMLIAIALVFLIMVATFRSILQPLVLLVSIPFAGTGAVLFLLVTNTPLALPALIGLLMLIGIVVTNAIVLIDLINKFRDEGESLRDAVINGARLRLRPILMTAAATIFALVPMSLGLTGGGVFISQPLAIVVIGGLLSSTLLTLVLVPVLYTMIEARKERRRAAREAKAAELRGVRRTETA